MSDKGGLVEYAVIRGDGLTYTQTVTALRALSKFVVDIRDLSMALGHPSSSTLRKIVGFIMGEVLKDFRPIVITIPAGSLLLDDYDWEGEIKIIAAQYNSSVKVETL